MAAQQTQGWYEITKDIVLPALSILSTVILGTIIASLLKNKEEKTKIKTLLIDNYMNYLNIKIKFFEHELFKFRFEILKDIYINYATYFEDHANRHLPIEEVKKRRDLTEQKLRSATSDDSNWSPYTFKFCFLLGTKKYNKEAQNLENVLVKNYLSNESQDRFITELKSAIRKNPTIAENMNATNISKIANGLDQVENLINDMYSDFQIKHFRPYDNKIADLIDAY